MPLLTPALLLASVHLTSSVALAMPLTHMRATLSFEPLVLCSWICFSAHSIARSVLPMSMLPP